MRLGFPGNSLLMSHAVPARKTPFSVMDWGTRVADRWDWGVVGLAIVLHISLGIDAARQWSATHDEFWHLPAGLAAWREARFDVDNLNPPLTRLWQALPLALGGARLPTGLPPDDAFTLGDQFLSANRQNYDSWFLAARVANLLLSGLTAVCLWVWGRDWNGRLAGVLAALLWLFCPVCLSNSALATPDAGATLLFVGTLWSMDRFARSPDWCWAVAVGLLLGLAQLTKFTNILLWIFCPWVWIVTRWRSGLTPVASSRLAGLTAMIVLLALLGWNAGYLFQGTGRPLGQWSFRSQSLQQWQTRLAGFEWIPVPLPADYLAGFDRQRATMEGSHPVYLDGTWNLTGFPGYYLYCAAYKWSHGTQFWVVFGLAMWLTSIWKLRRLLQRKRPSTPQLDRLQRHVRQGLLLLVPAAILVGVASSMGMQLGFRYILPAFPLLYLLAGLAAPCLWPSHRWIQLPIVLFIATSLCWGLRHHPHHLAYFNEWSGGLEGGRAHLADSNLDWGQDLNHLRKELQTRQIPLVRLAYFGMIPPGEVGINYLLPPSANQVAGGRPPAGWYAISVNFVLGRPHTIRNPDGSIRGVGYQEFGYFRTMKPVITLGGSLDLYFVEDRNQRPSTFR
ncbi:MAG TPA: hypothetical protein DDY91_20685 [Planctomycetaceae bacterium]|nr:hypothetical protein [Planctomycetaceae bacterium]